MIYRLYDDAWKEGRLEKLRLCGSSLALLGEIHFLYQTDESWFSPEII